MNTRHIHAWEMYIPKLDIELAEYISKTVEQSIWGYRRCSCGAKERCRKEKLVWYPNSLWALADEQWDPVG